MSYKAIDNFSDYAPKSTYQVAITTKSIAKYDML